MKDVEGTFSGPLTDVGTEALLSSFDQRPRWLMFYADKPMSLPLRVFHRLMERWFDRPYPQIVSGMEAVITDVVTDAGDGTFTVSFRKDGRWLGACDDCGRNDGTHDLTVEH